jgi:hypothetical protein
MSKRQCTDRVTFYNPSEKKNIPPNTETAGQADSETHTNPAITASQAPVNLPAQPERRRDRASYTRASRVLKPDFESMYQTVDKPGLHELPTGTAKILRLAGYDDFGERLRPQLDADSDNPLQNSLPDHDHCNTHAYDQRDCTSAAYSYGQPGVEAPHTDLQTHHSHIGSQYPQSPHPLGSQQALPAISFNMPCRIGLMEPCENGPASLDPDSQEALYLNHFLGVPQPDPSSAGPSGPPTPGSYATGSSAHHSPAPWDPDFSIFDSDS